MKTFTYIEVEPPRFRHSGDMVDWLNNHGRDGWLLVWMDNDCISAVFMKEVQP